MATNRQVRHPHRSRLDGDQEMELWLGPSHRGSAFESETQRQWAWTSNRDRLMSAWAKHGKRPWGWWRYESPVPYPRDRDYAEAALWENGLLTSTEATVLTAEWRQAFERAAGDPRFMFCVGFARPGDLVATWLAGKAARKAHYRWAGIPRDLLKRWTREHRRRGKTIRKLV